MAYTHIRGDSFSVIGRFVSSNMTGWEGRSQVRSAKTDELLSELAFVWTDAATGAFLVQINDTTAWPAGEKVAFDVQATSPNGVVISSPRVEIEILKDVTQNG